MKNLLAAAISLASLATPAMGADYDRTEKSPLCEIRLRVPGAAMAIAPLRDRIMAMYKADANEARSEAESDKQSDPSFSACNIDIRWRETFESDAALSLSGETYADTGAAHPADAFQTLVWDKKAGRALAIDMLFAPGQVSPALDAIAEAAATAWAKTYTARSGQKPGVNTDLAKDGIGPTPDKLKTYALTYAKGQTTANGIVLLYGAGQVWPHVLGDFRLSVPAAVFADYLAPKWKPLFGKTGP